MTDLFMQAAPHVHTHIAHAAPQIKYIHTGVSYMTAFISSAVALVAGFGLGWYVKGRGMQGVQNDLNNVKADVENLKSKLSVG